MEDRAAIIYAFDVLLRGNAPFLSNRRVFAVPVSGIPIGIKCDDKSHVYAGCSDGIEVWNSGGMLQAVIEIPGALLCGSSRIGTDRLSFAILMAI